MDISCDIVIVGAGIAGAAAAQALASFDTEVVLIDAEPRAPYHASARSAALCDRIYVPNNDVEALTVLGTQMLRETPGALIPKGSLHLYGEDDLELCAETEYNCRQSGARVEMLDADQIQARFPYLKTESANAYAGLYMRPGDANTIDVNRVFQRFKQRFRAMGGKGFLREPLLSATQAAGAWMVKTRSMTIRCDIIVNAAGAWADHVAERCGVDPLGMTPLKRTVYQAEHFGHPALRNQPGPFVFWDGAVEDLYCDFKADGRVLVSLADEQPSPPCDAEATGSDIVLARERFEQRTHVELNHQTAADWAGLRTFVQDRRPVIGWDPDQANFYWSGAYGGFGLECCLSASTLVAYDITGDWHAGEQINASGVRGAAFSPARLKRASIRHR